MYTYTNNSNSKNCYIFNFLGAVIGTIACSIFNGQQPIEASESPVNTLPHTSNSSSISNYRLRISKRNLSKGKMLKFVII